ATTKPDERSEVPMPSALSPTASNPCHVLHDQALHDHHIEPSPIETRVPFVDADFAESARAADGATRGVEREDARGELPVAAIARGVDQRGQQLPPEAAAARCAIEVDRKLRDARVARARTIAAQPRPAHQPIAVERDEDRKAICLAEPGENVIRRARLRLE